MASGMQPLRVWRGSYRALALEWGGSGGRLPPRTPAAQPGGRRESPRAASRYRIRAKLRVCPPKKGAGEPTKKQTSPAALLHTSAIVLFGMQASRRRC
jgi:hypothetical protein